VAVDPTLTQGLEVAGDHPTVAIIGGGYTGAAVAVHLARASDHPLNIHIVEPRSMLGGGVAYSASDPDHRVNGPENILILFPDDMDHFPRWYQESGRKEGDPGALAEDGQYFPRRSDFGVYMAERVAEYADANPSGSKIHHHQGIAENISKTDSGFHVELNDAAALLANMVVVTTNNGTPVPPRDIPQSVTSHSAFYTDPWDLDRMQAIASDASVLILGTGLTTADVTVHLMKQPDRQIVAVSRNGLVPQRQGPVIFTEDLKARLSLPEPPFIQRHGRPRSVRMLLRCLRQDIKARATVGEPWQEAFDDLRDALVLLWEELPLVERQRGLRHLRGLYETRRFRMVPQLSVLLDQAMADGKLFIQAGGANDWAIEGDQISVNLRTVQGGSEPRHFDAIINCTGPTIGPSANAGGDSKDDSGLTGQAGNAFLHSLVSKGLARPDALGLALDVDPHCCLIDAKDQADPAIRALGALTRGCFGEVGAVPRITGQISKALPDMLENLHGNVAKPE
jgi:uncharacterized NAD(P)/FAD-binding protein YdhS